jgi:hypothetical protein
MGGDDTFEALGDGGRIGSGVEEDELIVEKSFPSETKIGAESVGRRGQRQRISRRAARQGMRQVQHLAKAV